VRVGILNSANVVDHGGGLQYMVSLATGLRRFPDLDVTVFHDDPRLAGLCDADGGVRTVTLGSGHERFAAVVRAASTVANVRSPLVGRFSVLREHTLNCLVTDSSLIGFHLGIPFVGIIHDVMYRYYPHCGEYPWNERLGRELIYRRFGRHAKRIVVDSEHSKADLVRLFGMEALRIRAVPMGPPPHAYEPERVMKAAVAELKARRALPERFLFFPAQLWDHKNHRRLFEAVARLHRDGLVVSVVLTGGLRGATGEAILAHVSTLGLADQVVYLGYVSERDIVALYKLAVALVFPSFADYTNIPVLEAMALGTPVLCSNVFGMPEQVGDAGVLFDPFDVEDMAAAIRRVWESGELRRELVSKGRARAADLSLDAFAARWRDVIVETAGDTVVR
jgi:glycosyltransferase involved in cell wall biosynthesis